MAEDIEGRTALVTGGSSGIGEGIARELADRGANLVLVARREERLQELTAELAETHGVETDYVSMDLATIDAGDELYAEVNERGHEIEILVNNAGFGIYGNFHETEWDRNRAMMQLNMTTPARLTHLYANDMVERGWGRMMQVASIGGFQPSPTYATYSATKAFLLNWAEAIDFELRGTGVSSTVVCPGPVKTEFFDQVDQELTWYQHLTMMERDKVASMAVRAMLRQRMTIVPGFMNALAVWMVRFLPRRFVRWFAYQTMKNEG